MNSFLSEVFAGAGEGAIIRKLGLKGGGGEAIKDRARTMERRLVSSIRDTGIGREGGDAAGGRRSGRVERERAVKEDEEQTRDEASFLWMAGTQ